MSAIADLSAAERPAPLPLPTDIGRRLCRNPGVVAGAAILAAVFLIAIAAPWLGTVDPAAINPAVRNKLPGYEEIVRNADGSQSTIVHRMGTDTLGRDVYSRVAYGARASLMVGASVALIAVAIGLAIGLVAGYVRWLDGIVMRVMDGLMAIPAILLAIAVVSLSSAGLAAVIVAIVIPEIPRVDRLVRSVVLSVSGPSLPLDIGYSETIPAGIRNAVTLRDRHCRFPRGCNQPASACDVHHTKHKKYGGKTSTKDCVLLCFFHHQIVIHQWGWTLTLNPDGTTTAWNKDKTKVLHSHGPPARTG